MKKAFIVLIATALLMGSCGSYEATGAYTGSQFGNLLGSAIGGIAGGGRGHDIGALIGTVGGAAAGAAIGHAADKAQEQKYSNYASQRKQRSVNTRVDDRIDFETGNSYAAEPALAIRNAGIYEDHRDGLLTRGESCQVIFEVANNSSQPIYDVFPLVEEATGNKHISISPNMRIESIAPHQAIRYTATLKADNRLRDGQIIVRIGVAQGSHLVNSQTQQFTVPTAKQ